MGSNKRLLLAMLCTIVFILYGCKTDYLYDESLYYDEKTWNSEASVLNGKALKEDKGVYNAYDDGMEHLYLKVQEGKDSELDTTFSFSYLKNYTGSDNTALEPYCDVILTEGDEDSSSSITGFGFGEFTANAKLTVKGNTDRIQSRSWQIKLYDRAGLYEGMNTFNLIKNNDDASRMKIKLGMDISSQLDNMVALRTKFVRLFVYNTTEAGNLKWEDLGIYTLIEQPNKNFLRSHGLGENAVLYRAKDFRFEKHKEIMNNDNPEYDEEIFEKVLGIREASNHGKIVETLSRVNQSNITSDTLFSSSLFNEENLLTYASLSIMMGNVESTITDYLLYSPENSQTWYFLPEDFRNAFEYSEWQSYAYLMNNKIFRIYLKEEENRVKLRDKINGIRKIITDEWITEKVSHYTDQLLPYIYSMPEIIQLPIPAEGVEPYISELTHNISQVDNINFEYFPPYIEEYHRTVDRVVLDFTSQTDLTYYAEISADRKFTEITKSIPLSDDNSFEYGIKGTYYLRVIGITAEGERIICGNISLDSLGRTVYGGIEVQ